MAIRVFHPDEAVMIPADKIVGVQQHPEGWFIPRVVIDGLTPIERDSLFYALGRRIDVEDFDVFPATEGFYLTPNDGSAIHRFTARSRLH
jgi:hypothetical protein